MNSQNVSIRPVREGDARAIAELYAPYVLTTPFTFETEPPSEVEMRARIVDLAARFPWLVAELNGEVVGYAYASPHRSRCAYEWSVESSVYVEESSRRQRIGTALYRALLPLVEEQGVVNVLAGITAPNDASTRLHQSLGFRHIGSFANIGYKLGSWWSVDWWQLQLRHPDRPSTLRRPARA